MASNVQVVLKHEVEHLGQIGEVVRVRRGYARNYLIPRGLAVMATRGNMKQAEHEKRLADQRAEKLRAEQEKLAQGLKGLVLMVAKEASPEGKLFGSCTKDDVLEAISRKGFEVDRKKLVMPESAIKEVGSYSVGVKFGHGVTAEVKLEVKTRA